MNAVRASESVYYYRWMRSVGMMENYQSILKRGQQGMELCPQDPDIPLLLGSMCGRNVYAWYNPYRLFGLYYGVPSKKVMQQEAIRYLSLAQKNDPNRLEITFRLGQAYLQAGDFANARRWLCKVRDEMPVQDLHDEKWQSLAHTALSTSFQKTRWNVPFA